MLSKQEEKHLTGESGDSYTWEVLFENEGLFKNDEITGIGC